MAASTSTQESMDASTWQESYALALQLLTHPSLTPVERIKKLEELRDLLRDSPIPLFNHEGQQHHPNYDQLWHLLQAWLGPLSYMETIKLPKIILNLTRNQHSNALIAVINLLKGRGEPAQHDALLAVLETIGTTLRESEQSGTESVSVDIPDTSVTNARSVTIPISEILGAIANFVSIGNEPVGRASDGHEEQKKLGRVRPAAAGMEQATDPCEPCAGGCDIGRNALSVTDYTIAGMAQDLRVNYPVAADAMEAALAAARVPLWYIAVTLPEGAMAATDIAREQAAFAIEYATRAARQATPAAIAHAASVARSACGELRTMATSPVRDLFDRVNAYGGVRAALAAECSGGI